MVYSLLDDPMSAIPGPSEGPAALISLCAPLLQQLAVALMPPGSSGCIPMVTMCPWEAFAALALGGVWAASGSPISDHSV